MAIQIDLITSQYGTPFTGAYFRIATAAAVTAPSVEPDTVEIDGVTYEKVEIDGQTVLKPVEA
jgi:hypothetical protein